MMKKKLCSLADKKRPDIGFEYFPSFTFLCVNGCGQIKMNYCCRGYSLVFPPPSYRPYEFFLKKHIHFFKAYFQFLLYIFFLPILIHNSVFSNIADLCSIVGQNAYNKEIKIN